MSNRIDAVVWLDPPILLQGSLAGDSRRVLINKRRTTLTLPTEPADLPWRDTPPAIPPFPDPPLAEAFSEERGGGGSRQVFEDDVFAAGAIRLQFSDPASTEDLPTSPTIAWWKVVDAWLKMVREWLYAWTVRPGRDHRRPPLARVLLALPDKPELEPRELGGQHLTMLGERAATPGEWNLALQKASANEVLPLPYRLISEAILRRASKEPRLAVITAGSAAEVALSNAARTALKAAGLSGKDIKDIVRGTSGVVDLYRLCSLHPDRPNITMGRLASKLAEPRNRAAHEGKDPEDAAVSEAISTALELVRMTPLPRPGDGDGD